MRSDTSAKAPSKSSLAELAQAGQRLAAELHAVFDVLPAEARGTRNLARYLGIDRNLCQKALLASRCGDAESLVAAPGPKSLELLAAALERTGMKPGTLRGLNGAIERLRGVIAENGGTHSALKAVIAKLLHPDQESPSRLDLDTGRREHFALTSELLGLSVDLTNTVAIFSEANTGSEQRMRMIGAKTHMGVAMRAGGLPMTLSIQRCADEQTREAGPVRSWILPQFSSSPLPVVSSRHSPDYTSDLLEAVSKEGEDAPLDVVLATQFDPTAFQHGNMSQIIASYSIIRQPTRRLVADMFVEVPLATGRIPTAGAYLWNVRLDRTEAADQWFDRLPEHSRLQVLGTGLQGLAQPVWPRQRELYEHLFKIDRIDPERFIGFRMDVAYPMTGSQYRIALDTPIGA